MVDGGRGTRRSAAEASAAPYTVTGLTLCLAPVFRAGLGGLEYSASLALSEEYRVPHNFETQFQHKISAYHNI